MRNVILTDEKGANKGTLDVLEAHSGEGHLHRAFSIFVFRNNKKELLIQKRSDKKMLWPGFWANTCCSHPSDNNDLIPSAEKRLMEECGFSCPLTIRDSFVYRAKDPRGAGSEYEYDTVLVGEVDEVELNPNPNEVSELKWIEVDTLMNEISSHPGDFAPWLIQALDISLSDK